MVLLFNVFITNQSATGGQWERLGVHYDRGNLNNPNRFDIVKYALSSTAKAYPWKRAIIKVELDSSFNSETKKEELEQFVKEEFKGVDLYFYHTRNKFQEDWIETYNLINDDLIYYQGNHDHIFINSSNNILKNIVDSVSKDNTSEFKTVVVSHWSEAIRSAKSGYISPDQYTSSKLNENYNETNNFISYDGLSFDSFNIISKELYKNWFIQGDWNSITVNPEVFLSGRVELPRTEGVGIIGLGSLKNDILKVPTPTQRIYIPYEEIFRHFDGYFHQKIPNSICPAIDIPIGYFEKTMKIRYGYDDYKEGWININPKSEHYYAFDKTGVDYKFTLNDLPYIWKDRIIDIDSNPNISEEEMIQYRLKSILEMVYNSEKYNPYINNSIKDNVLKHYLKNFPQYSLD